MAEEMAMLQNRILPDELMIEILSRVDTSNHLDLRCVCKLWKSLVLDPHFMNNHVVSLTDLVALSRKAVEHFNAFKSRIKEEEEEEEEEDVDVDFNVEVEVKLDVDVDDDVDVGEVEEEEEDGDSADVDAGEKEEEEEQIKLLDALIKFMVKEKQLKEKGENLDINVQWMIIKVAKLDNYSMVVRYIKSFMLNFLKSINSLEDEMVLKGNIESIKDEMQTMEDRAKYFKSFMQTYLVGFRCCL